MDHLFVFEKSLIKAENMSTVTCKGYKNLTILKKANTWKLPLIGKFHFIFLP